MLLNNSRKNKEQEDESKNAQEKTKQGNRTNVVVVNNFKDMWS